MNCGHARRAVLRRVERYLRFGVGDVETSPEDITSEVIRRLFERRSAGETAEAAARSAERLVQSKCVDAIRRKHRRLSTCAIDAATHRPARCDLVAEADMHLILRRFLAKLTRRQRDTIRRTISEGHSDATAALLIHGSDTPLARHRIIQSRHELLEILQSCLESDGRLSPSDRRRAGRTRENGAVGHDGST
jgi:DNA-directed RNA polymerase specialized sigma24 family protein